MFNAKYSAGSTHCITSAVPLTSVGSHLPRRACSRCTPRRRSSPRRPSRRLPVTARWSRGLSFRNDDCLGAFVEKSTVAWRQALQTMPDWSDINGSIGGLLLCGSLPFISRFSPMYRGHRRESVLYLRYAGGPAAIRQRIFTPLTISGSIFAVGARPTPFV